LGKNPVRRDENDGVEPPKLAAPEPPDDTTPSDSAASESSVEKKAPPPKALTWMQALRKGDDKAFETALDKELKEIIARYPALNNYEILFLFDDDSITAFHSDRLYSAAKGTEKDILLIIDSPGGRIEPAYLISKTLKRIAANKFCAAVPRRAKSAATLIALGADEIHMGMISQLGPIDPQVSGLPALALGNALNHIADIAEKYPGSSDMLTKYLIDQAPIRILGYYERVSESAAQYAERLLTGKSLPDGKSAAEVAKHLVQHYKDHSFVIDTEEALKHLGNDLIKEQTAEYDLADELYQVLEFVQLVANFNKKSFWLVGSLPDGITLRKMSSS
jgi:hypothetical protein